MAAIACLGFCSGLPLYLLYKKVAFWMREEGVDLSTIGFFSAVGLAYSLKVFWSPLVDKLKIPFLWRLGQRRAWMLLSIAGTVVGLLVISASDPSEGIGLLLAGALILAYAGASLDVAIDAWRIESAPAERQANMAASYSLGYRIALIYSGLGFVLADLFSWSVSFTFMACSMGVAGASVLFVKEPAPSEKVAPRRREPLLRRLVKLVVEPFSQAWERFGRALLPILALVLIYRTSDFTMGVMATPLYVDLGYDKMVIGAIQSGPGVAATFVGLFVGGLVAQRLGMMKGLFIGAVLTLVTNGAYALFALVATGDDPLVLVAAVCADNFAGGFVTTVFIAYLSSLVDPAHAATQYAFFSSVYALANKLVASLSGLLAEAVGFVSFFLITASYAIPAALLVLYVSSLEPTPEASAD